MDSVVLIKMLRIDYLYGLKSERRLEEEVSFNLAYRCGCGIDLMHRVPDHSTFSQNRKRRFQEASIFREIFNEIVLKCIELGSAYREKLVLLMVHSFHPMYPGTATMRQLRRSNVPL